MKSKQGLVHLYYGMGKGKTTAAAGLCVRMLGRGGKVLFAQFLKTGDSGEVAPLKELGAAVLAGQELTGFFGTMSPEDKAACAAQNRDCLEEAARAMAGGYELVVLDEIIDGVTLGIFSEEEVAAAIRNRSPGTEVVVTGHSAPEGLLAAADYVTEMIPRRHPFQEGITARKGIEF